MSTGSLVTLATGCVIDGSMSSTNGWQSAPIPLTATATSDPFGTSTNCWMLQIGNDDATSNEYSSNSVPCLVVTPIWSEANPVQGNLSTYFRWVPYPSTGTPTYYQVYVYFYNEGTYITPDFSFTIYGFTSS